MRFSTCLSALAIAVGVSAKTGTASGRSLQHVGMKDRVHKNVAREPVSPSQHKPRAASSSRYYTNSTASKYDAIDPTYLS